MTVTFTPSEEQAMLREGARRWGARRDPAAPEDLAATWAHFAEMGWLMAGLPEAAGGLGGTLQDSAIIAEELGRALVRAPFVEIAVTTAHLLLVLDPDRVPAIADGSSRPVLAHDEAEARGDLTWVRTTATKDGAGWRLTGRKTAIVGAPDADSFLVTARIGDTDAIGVFEVAAAGAPLRAYAGIDYRPAGELRLKDTPATQVGSAGDALPAIVAAMEKGSVCESADAVGAMQRALEMTREYLMTRRQYGKLIGEFQVLRHRVADMFIEVEQARSIVLRALQTLASDDPRARALAVAAARARVGQAGQFVGAQAIQLHGGIGVTVEYPIGRFFQRLVAYGLRHGTAVAQVERFAALRREGANG